MKKKTTPLAASARARVLLVEDHPMLRKGLADSINEDPNLTTCAQTGSAREAMKLAAAARPDIAVVDISLPDGHGLELIKNLKAILPHLKILVLSMHDEAVYSARVLRAGALGYVMKSEPPDSVLKAIRKVMRGEFHFSPSQIEHLLLQMAEHPAKAARSPEELLTDRELEILEQLGRGFTPKAIASHLHLSLKTVQAHRENIKRKLGFSTAPSLAHFAFSWSRDRSSR